MNGIYFRFCLTLQCQDYPWIFLNLQEIVYTLQMTCLVVTMKEYLEALI